MKKLLIAMIAFLGVAIYASHVLAAKADDAQKITGILIDEKCGTAKDGKPKSEADAAKHGAGCVAKCAGGGSSLQITSGEKVYKLDEASKAKALEYLKNEKGEGSTRVAVEGTVKDDTLTITSIKKAEKPAA